MGQKASAKDNRESGLEPTGTQPEKWDKRCKFCGTTMQMENPEQHDIEIYECPNKPCRAQARVELIYGKGGILIMEKDPVDNMPPFNFPAEMYRKTWMPEVER